MSEDTGMLAACRSRFKSDSLSFHQNPKGQSQGRVEGTRNAVEACIVAVACAKECALHVRALTHRRGGFHR